MDFTYAASLMFAKSRTYSERNGSRACKNSWGVIEKDFVDDSRGERSGIDHGTAFNQQAGDLHFAEKADDSGHLRMTIRSGCRQLLDANASSQQLLFLFLFRKRAEHQDIVLGRLCNPRVKWQTQA